MAATVSFNSINLHKQKIFMVPFLRKRTSSILEWDTEVDRNLKNDQEKGDKRFVGESLATHDLDRLCQFKKKY